MTGREVAIYRTVRDGRCVTGARIGDVRLELAAPWPYTDEQEDALAFLGVEAPSLLYAALAAPDDVQPGATVPVGFAGAEALVLSVLDQDPDDEAAAS